jgi:hypothetical protein
MKQEEGVHVTAYQVCSYYGVWYHVIQDKETSKPRLGEPAPEVHEYDCEDKTKFSKDSNKEPEQDPIDDEIRHSPVEVSLRLGTNMLATRTAPTVMVTLARAASPAPMAGTTPALIKGKLNMALRHTGPPGGGEPTGPGGPSGPGGPGGPGMLGGRPGQVHVPQQPVPPAGNIKTMGQLPQVFTGDQARADNFIEEVKGYLRLNQDVAGFDSPMKKIVFMLMLIKQADMAGWT